MPSIRCIRIVSFHLNSIHFSLYSLIPFSSSNIYVGSLAHWAGRRIAIIVGFLIFLLGGGIQTGAQNIHYMYGGRFLAGMGIGMLAMLAPLYQAEIAHPSIRGRLTTLQQFMLGIGALIASFIGYGCFHGLTGQAQWRLPRGESKLIVRLRTVDVDAF